MNHVLLGVAIFSVLFAVCNTIYGWLRERKLIRSLNKMLDSAIDGSFTESRFDESVLSAFESRFNQYLCSCTVSAKNLSQEKDKIKELIADISHQTKTPIANILLYAQLLSEQKLPDESKDCVVALSTQAEKLSFLIASLIKTSRLEAGIITLNPKKRQVNALLQSVKRQITPKAERKQIKLLFTESSEFAIFDEKWTAEALYNLVDNGVKYTPEQGEIHISVTPYQLFLRIDIKDTGIGIAEEEQANIFSRFYRSKTVNETEGVGIGLYLAREIISGEGGYIKVKSTLGKGSMFSVFLPMESEKVSF